MILVKTGMAINSLRLGSSGSYLTLRPPRELNFPPSRCCFCNPLSTTQLLHVGSLAMVRG
jgi:hypothetical protein